MSKKFLKHGWISITAFGILAAMGLRATGYLDGVGMVLLILFAFNLANQFELLRYLEHLHPEMNKK